MHNLKVTYNLKVTHNLKDLNLLYSIGTPESHTYEGVECCPYAGFLYFKLVNGNRNDHISLKVK